MILCYIGLTFTRRNNLFIRLLTTVKLEAYASKHSDKAYYNLTDVIKGQRCTNSQTTVIKQ